MTPRSRDVVERGPAEADASVIWLHGLGADGHDFAPLADQLRVAARPVRFVFPHAPPRPVTINGGLIMRAWYDVRGFDLDARSHDRRGIEESVGLVEDLIDHEVDRGVAPERIVVGGFSQGAALALFLATRRSGPLAGVAALSGYWIPGGDDDGAVRADRALPIFLAHGALDPVVPPAAGEHARDELVRLGFAPAWRTYPAPHAVHPDEIADLDRWLESVLFGPA